MKIDLTQYGSVWVASNGQRSADGPSPELAVHALLEPEESAEEDAQFLVGQLVEGIEICCLRLIKLLALNSPQLFVENEYRLIGKKLAEYYERKE